MESCFVLSIESENEPSGLVTYSVEGVLTDGQRMVLRPPTQIAIEQIVQALQMAKALDPKMIEAIDRLKGSYRLSVDIGEEDAVKFVDAFNRLWAAPPLVV
jgi:hypothetical protein